MRVKWHPRVMNELLRARDYYNKCRPGLGESFLDDFDDRIAAIETAPQQWAKVSGEVRRVLMLLSATRKLFDKLPLDANGLLQPNPHTRWLHDAPPLSANPLGGWQGNLVTLQRRNCVMLLHEATRFPLFLPALGKQDFAAFNYRFVDALMNTLLKCGAEDRHLDAAQQYLRPLQVTAHCNRSAQGTLNQMKFDLDALIWQHDINIAEQTGYRIGAWMAERPTLIKGKDVIWPRDAFLRLLASLADGEMIAATGTPTDIGLRELPDNVVSLQDYRSRS